MASIEISNQQRAVEIDVRRIRRAAEAILLDADIADAQLSVAIVDDATIHELNRRYLEHNYPTDVLSFVLDRDAGRLEGEVIASAETASRVATQYGWSADDELLLYVIHGALHLVGHDDATPEGRATMRRLERRYLALFDLQPRDEQSACDPSSPVELNREN